MWTTDVDGDLVNLANVRHVCVSKKGVYAGFAEDYELLLFAGTPEKCAEYLEKLKTFISGSEKLFSIRSEL